MKMNPTLKRLLWLLAVLAWLAIVFLLFIIIVMSDLDIHVDFSPAGLLRERIHDAAAIEEAQPSLAAPMLLMLLGALLGMGTLIIRQCIAEYRRVRDMLTPQWIDRSRTMQVILGLVAAVLMALIGVCLDAEQNGSLLPWVLSAALILRLVVYGVQSALRKK